MKDKMQETQKNNKTRKKKVRRLKTIVWLQIVLVVAIIAFLGGRKIGQKEAYHEIIEVQNQQMEEYAAQQEELPVENLVEGESAETTVSQNYMDSSMNEAVEKSQLNAEALEQLRKDNPEWILVNKNYKLPEDYEVELKTLPDRVNQASVIAYDALVQMLKDGRKEGLNFEVCSSYRSVERQEELLKEDIEILMEQGFTYREAYNEVTRETMPPGYSEHSTGLAFDIVALSYQMLDEGQERTKENQWLREHCSEYGFILRYPEGKEDITGIDYESWHFRYVGEKAAQYITEEELTLEEYLEKQWNNN